MTDPTHSTLSLPDQAAQMVAFAKDVLGQFEGEHRLATQIVLLVGSHTAALEADLWITFEEMLDQATMDRIGISKDRPISQCLVRALSELRDQQDRNLAFRARVGEQDRANDALLEQVKAELDAARLELMTLRSEMGRKL